MDLYICSIAVYVLIYTHLIRLVSVNEWNEMGLYMSSLHAYIQASHSTRKCQRVE